jgi:hypothetical protein
MTLYEHQNTSDGFDLWIRYNLFLAQTFTPSESHKLQQVRVKGYRSSDAAGTVYCRIYATSAGVPVGSPLESVEVDYSGWQIWYSDAVWEQIDLSGDLVLSAGTQYAIALEKPDGAGLLRWIYGVEADGGPYAGGALCTNSGYWTIGQPNGDAMFEEYGSAPGPSIPVILDMARMRR